MCNDKTRTMGAIRKALRGLRRKAPLPSPSGGVSKRPSKPRGSGFASAQLEKENEFARLSQLSYEAEEGTGADSAFARAFQASGLDRHYAVESDLSNANHTTFRDTRTGRGVVAFRGSNVKNMGDMGTNAAIAFGLHRLTPRFREAEDVTRSAIARFGGKDNVDVTGHSLGGTQAMHATNRTGVHSYSFNPGAGLTRGQLSMMGLGVVGATASLLNRGRLDAGNAHVISTGVDPISMMSRASGASHRYVVPRSADVHGIKNFV